MFVISRSSTVINWRNISLIIAKHRCRCCIQFSCMVCGMKRKTVLSCRVDGALSREIDPADVSETHTRGHCSCIVSRASENPSRSETTSKRNRCC